MATQTTTLGRKWLMKMGAFFVVSVALGIWGLWDATVAYPARGERAAERLEFRYLDLLTRSGAQAAIVNFDPRQEFDRLRQGRASWTDEDRVKHDWLQQLAILGQLEPARTSIPDAVARYRELSGRVLNASGQPRPAAALAWYDIPVQWAIAATGFGLALWLVIHVARVARRRYSWDPAEKRLSLPDGSSLVPADIAEFDKRKWDKFLIYLSVKPHHDRHGGRELMLDLYHHTPLEEWVLEMERVAGLDSAEPNGPGEPAAEAAAAGGSGAR